MTSTISAMGFRGFGKLVAGGFQWASALAVEPIGFLRMGAHSLGDDLGRHHALAQPGGAGVAQPLPSTGLVQA
jgi:hypothetical protein